jgi:hypothetical protein
MDSGLGSIGRKIIKLVRQSIIRFFRKRANQPGRNALFLSLIFGGWLAYYKFQPDTVGRLVMENEYVGSFMKWLFIVIFLTTPVLAIINSFSFQKVWQKTISVLLSAIVTIHVIPTFLLFILIGFVLSFDNDDDEVLIRQTITPDGQITRVQAWKSTAMTPGDGTWYCRSVEKQRRVFPGILRIESFSKTCLSRGQPFPPEFQ